MWKIVNVKKEHIEKFIVFGEDVVVGRKDVNFKINDDPSISRKHAVVFVKHSEENLGNPDKPSSLFLRDESSKYGTFKNGKKVNNIVELKKGDIIKFGQFESEYRVSNIPLVVTTSCLDLSGKRELKKIIHNLGGHLVSEWQPSCTHLVMSEVKVTIKALCCLCSVKPIVKPVYFTELLNSIKTSSTFIFPNQYVPPIGEALIDKELVSFDINDQRKVLFKHKTFFFLDEKQFKKLHLGIVLGGGEASILSSTNVTPELLLQENSCVIEPMHGPSQLERSFHQEVLDVLQEKNLRMIPESDVGLAVAYCSTDKFCNPAFSMVDAVLRSQKLQSQTLTQREVYVPDTQEREQRAEQAKNIVTEVGESLNFSSFHAAPVEEMDLSELPLSAKVKKELADIFDEPMDEEMPEVSFDTKKMPDPPKKEVASISVTKSDSSSGPSFFDQNDRPSTRSKKESVVKHIPEQNGHVNGNIYSISKKSIKLEVTNVNEDPEEVTLMIQKIHESTNHLHAEIMDIPEPELPRNLVKIEFRSLLCKRKPLVPTVQQYKNSSVKNFKKFRKVQPKRANMLPKIIGAHELVPYDKIAAQVSSAAWDESAEEAPQPIKGAFDWDTPTV